MTAQIANLNTAAARALPLLLAPAAALGCYLVAAPLAHGVRAAYAAFTAPRVIVLRVPEVPAQEAPKPIATEAPKPVATLAPKPVPAPARPKPAPPPKHKRPGEGVPWYKRTDVPREILEHRPHIIDGEDDMVEIAHGGIRGARSIHPYPCTPDEVRQNFIALGVACPAYKPHPKIYGPIFYDEYGLAHSHAY